MVLLGLLLGLFLGLFGLLCLLTLYLGVLGSIPGIKNVIVILFIVELAATSNDGGRRLFVLGLFIVCSRGEGVSKRL